MLLAGNRGFGQFTNNNNLIKNADEINPNVHEIEGITLQNETEYKHAPSYVKEPFKKYKGLVKAPNTVEQNKIENVKKIDPWINQKNKN